MSVETGHEARAAETTGAQATPASAEATGAQATPDSAARPAPVAPPGEEKQETPHKAESLPNWAQNEMRVLRKAIEEYQQRDRDRDQAARRAEEERLKEQGEWKSLFEQKDAELRDLRAQIEYKERRERAWQACKDAEINPEDWVDLIQGDTAEELQASAKRIAAKLPKPQAPATEGGQRSTGAAPQTRPDTRRQLAQTGRYSM